MTFHFLPRVLAGLALLTAAPILTGCSGVVKNLNSAQVNVPNVAVANPFGLDKQGAAVGINSLETPAAVPHVLKPQAAANVNTFSFPNQNPVGLADIKSAQVAAALVPTVTLDGTAQPAKFTLATFVVDGVVSDTDSTGSGSSVALTELATSGPLSFTRQADGSYLADAGTIQLAQQSKTTDATLTSLLNIVTAGPTPNTATLTLNATSPDLPNGTLMHVTFDSTKLTVSASQ